MEDPKREIETVIRSLTQGTRQDQENTLTKYFLPNAYFVHPFCRVPSFAFGGVDSESSPKKAGSAEAKQLQLNSRALVQLVYQWYKILSPKIDLTIDSAAFDSKAGMLYVTIHQKFTIWVVPFNLWQANVKLVSVLELTSKTQQDQKNGHDEQQGARRSSIMSIPEAGETKPSYAEVAAPGPTPALHKAPSNSSVKEEEPKKIWYIRGQEDHYQVEQFLKFVSPFGPLWFLWQLFATFLCMLGVALLWPVTTMTDSKKQKDTTKTGSKNKRH